MKRTCRKIQETLAAEGPRALRGDRASQEHVSGCSGCFDFLESISQLDEGLKNLPAFDAPDATVERLLARPEIARDAGTAPPETADDDLAARWWQRVRDLATRPLPVKPFAWSTAAMLVVAITAFLLIEEPPFDQGPFVTAESEGSLKFYKPPPAGKPANEVAPASAMEELARQAEVEPVPELPQGLDRETVERLRGLGYIAGKEEESTQPLPRLKQKRPAPRTGSPPPPPESRMEEEEVKVVETLDVVDLEHTESTNPLGDSFASDLPVPGRLYQEVPTLAPGVPNEDDDGNEIVHGSRSRDFETEVGGVSNVDPLTGEWLTRVNPNSIEEMEVITSGAGVEFGRAAGGDTSVVESKTPASPTTPDEPEPTLKLKPVPRPKPAPPSGPLMAGAAAATLPVLIEQSKVSPDYPEAARVARVEGQVILRIAVLKDGTVGKIEVLTCSRPGLGFEESAIEAVGQWRYEPARQGGSPADVFLAVTVDFSLGSPAGAGQDKKNGAPGRSAIEDRSLEVAQAFLDDRASLEGLKFKRPMGYWSNTYVPGDPAMRLLQARLLESDRSVLQAMAGAPLQLHDVSRRVAQPFDPPQDSALAISLHADRRGLTEEGRLLVQVGLKGTVRQGGRRPAMSLALVLDLRGDVSPATAAGIRAIVDAFNQAREPGDRFHVIVAGRPGAVVVRPDEFRHGFLMVTLDQLLSAGEIEGARKLGIVDSVETAVDTVIASDDSGAPLGSSAVVLVTARSLGNKAGRLADLAHRSAVAGVSLSVIGLGQDVVPSELDRVVLAGQGNRRVLLSPSEAMDLVEHELSAVSRIVARAVRLRIRLAPGVRLIEVVGSDRLGARRVQRVREAEKSIDRRIAQDLGIRADRGEDEEGIQIVIPAFHSGDTHFVLLDVVAPGPGPLAEVSVRYKDLVYLRNGVGRASLALGHDTRPAGPLERSVLKSLLSLRLSAVLELAGRAVAKGNRESAAKRLAGFETLMTGLLLSIPGLANDPGLRDDIAMLAEYRALLEGDGSARADLRAHLADSLRYASRLKVLAQPRTN